MFDILGFMATTPTPDPSEGDGPFAGFTPLTGQADVLAELMAAVPSELTDGELGDGLVALSRLSGQLDAALAAYTTVFEARGLPSVDGARSVGAWLTHRSELPRQRVSDLLAIGRDLRHCPIVAAAYATGVLGTAKVRALLAARHGLEALFAAHEQMLVDEIARLTAQRARYAIASWRRLALATTDQEEETEPADESVNSLHLSQTLGGRWALNANLDVVSGRTLANAIDAIIDAEFRTGNGPTPVERSGRKAAALIALVERGSQPGTKHGQQRPSVHLIWDADDLLGIPAADLAQAMQRRCQLADGTTIPRPVAERLLCTADITDLLVRFGIDGTPNVLGVTHTHRYASMRERKALQERDRGCIFPGCQAPAAWCDAHHTIPYEIGHHTTLDELVLVCPTHHRAVHEGGFTLTRTKQGHIYVLRPDRTHLPAPGQGHFIPDERQHPSHPPGTKPPKLRPRTRFTSLAEAA